MPTPQTPVAPSGHDSSDPTVLTTQQLWREMEHAKELSQSQLDDFKSLVLEKFDGVKQKFEDLDKAVTKAFNSAKESIADQNKSNAEATHKAEQGFKESIIDLSKLIQSENKSTNDKVEQIQKRLDLMEGRDKGFASSWGIIIGLVGFGVAAVTIINAIFK